MVDRLDNWSVGSSVPWLEVTVVVTMGISTVVLTALQTVSYSAAK